MEKSVLLTGRDSRELRILGWLKFETLRALMESAVEAIVRCFCFKGWKNVQRARRSSKHLGGKKCLQECFNHGDELNK